MNNTIDNKQQSLEMEISRDGASLRVGIIRKTMEEKETLRHYQEKPYNSERVHAKCAEIVRLLNNANIRGSLAGENFRQLQNAGFFLFEELLPREAQQELSSGDSDTLIINIDDGLVHIPWELLYDGTEFLCRRFNAGRVVRTRQSIIRPQARPLAVPLKMLIICDPVGDLAKAYEEGDRIRTEMDKAAFLVQSDLFNYRVDAVTLKEYIRSYDIIHYAGHADYDPGNPSESGWLLHNSKLTAQDIYHMSPNLPLPALVFSNACQSGQTGEWRLDEGYESRIFGLANAFLLSGVQHYIGTFWEVLDESSCEFSAAFYNHLIRGEPIGSAMKKAREHLVEVYGEEQIVWASYMLYGNPATRYVTEQEIGDGKGMSIPSVLGMRTQGIEAFPSGPTRSLPPDRRLFNLMTFAYILIGLSLILMVVVVQDRLHLFKGERQPAEPATTISEKKTTEETSAILARLSERYAQHKKQAKEPVPADAWTSRMLTLSLLGFSCIGDCSRDSETEQYILAHLSQDVSRGSRVSLVEREKISQLLEELQLSTADFADQVAAPVMLGKLLGARLIAAGKIVRIKGDNALSLRVFETETSHIVISLAEPWNENDKAGTINRLAQALSREIKTLYPLKGTIARIKPDEILLNIGSRVGVRADTVFAVLADAEPLRMEGKTLGYDEKKIGTIKVATVEENFSRCSIVKQDTPFKEGARVIEVVQ